MNLIRFIREPGKRTKIDRYLYRAVHKLASRGFVLPGNPARIHRLRGAYFGRTGLLLGNGPSVRIEDLDLIADKTDLVTFACNRFHMAYDKTVLRPDFTLSTDEQTIGDFGQEIVTESAGHKLLASFDRPAIQGDYIWLRPLPRARAYEFSECLHEGVMVAGATLVAAAQVGYWCGIREFYLYGVDHNYAYTKVLDAKNIYYSAKGEGNHFIDNYRSGKAWCPPATGPIETAFKTLDSHFRIHGGFLKNATRGGKLEVVERADFDKLMSSMQ